MVKKIFILFKLARKIALSDALKVVSNIHRPPLIVRLIFAIFSISFSNKNLALKNLSE